MKDGVFLSNAAIKEITKFASHADTRYALCGIWIDSTDKLNPIIEATDGHRMHRIQINNDSILSPDSYLLTKSELEKPRNSIKLTIDELGNAIFKIKEIIALSKMKGRTPSIFENIVIKFSSNRVIFIANKNILIRYIQPAAGIPVELVGFAIGINTKYLLDGLEVFTGKEINVLIADKRSAIVIKQPEADYPLHIIMPAHIPDRTERR